ncbi:MAG: hypothetical protein HYY25_10655 [Candidatus Wallbacteria bacterium]|nr:hypothetical protein [Candidatus Wallbacteria bacterium]MBI4867746.1 hypothetical protein [Candidatus Wallbacteria bacterium]
MFNGAARQLQGLFSRRVRTGLWLLLVLALAPLAVPAAPPEGAGKGAAEVAAQLQKLRAEYREEVTKNGFDTDRAKELRDEIARLEKLVPTELGGGGTGTSSGSGSTSGADKPDPSKGVFVDGITTVAGRDKLGDAGNPCGAYAVATILQSFGHDVNLKEIFDEIVPIKFGTSPHDIKRYLQRAGHSVTDRNNGSLDDIARAVDRDERIMMLVNVGGGGDLEKLHWASVKGYRINDKGEREWQFEDTYWGGSKWLSEAEVAKCWDKPALGEIAGFNNYYMSVSKDPPGAWERINTALYGLNGRTSVEVLTSGLRDVTRGWEDLTGGGRTVGERIGGFFTMVGGGFTKVIGGVVGAIPTLAGNALQSAGDSMMGWGAKKWNEGGFFNKVAGAGATVLGAITKGVGWVLTGVGAVISGIAGAIGDAASAIGDALGDAWDTVSGWF